MSRRRLTVIGLAVLACLFMPIDDVQSYVLSGGRWDNGNIVMQLQLGSSGMLIDGSASWGASAEDALATWNTFVSRSKFTVVRDSTAAINSANGLNNVFWSPTVYGKPFGGSASPTQGGSVLAVTLSFDRGSNRLETDVIFNNGPTWDSYRGRLRQSTAGGTLNEFHRVALHEFGHVLGLLHPDDYGQNVAALMNSTIGDLDALTGDDVAGGVAAYGAPSSGPPVQTAPSSVIFPSQEDVLAFRQALDAKYRDDLKRTLNLTAVDMLGDALWLEEYARFRVFQCSADEATSRVLQEIDDIVEGKPSQVQVCGRALTSMLPPRDDMAAFRQRLETKYRTDLGRAQTSVYADPVGITVWVREYLQDRVNRLNHKTAQSDVFRQIDSIINGR